MSDIKKGYTFTDKSTDWASNKETSIRLNKMMDEAKLNLVAGTNVTITPTINGPQIDVAGAGTGSVTSIDVDGGTGISVSPAGPITTAGTFTVTNTAPDQVVALTGGTGITTSGTYPNFTVTNSAPDQTVAISGGTGITTSGTYPSFTVTNSAPDQTVALTQGGTTTITGTYPNFTISSADQYTGTVTSVSGAGGGTGLTLSGGPITGSGTLTLGGTLAVANGGTGTASPSLVAGTNVTISGSWPNQTVNSTAGGGGGGTVTSVSVVSGNGLAGTVANATTTPAITLSTTVNGLVKGNGTTLSAATAGSDYQAPITLTTTGTSGAATFVSNTLNIPQYAGGGGSGTVTSVSVVTANGVSGSVANSTTTPAITLTLGDISAATSKPPSGTARSFESRNTDIVNVKDYGALGNGGDDSTAINNAITRINSSNYGGILYFPAGTYGMGTTALTTITKSVKILGDGIGVTTIALAATLDGFNINFSAAPGPRFASAYDFTITTANATTANTALTFKQKSGSTTKPSFEFCALSIEGCWSKGIFINNAAFNDSQGGTIRDISLVGTQGATTRFDYGIYIAGASNINVSSVKLTEADVGCFVSSSPKCEGVWVSDSIFVNTRLGVEAAGPNTWMTNIHANVSNLYTTSLVGYGFYVTGNQSILTGCYMLTDKSTSIGFYINATEVSMTNSRALRVSGTLTNGLKMGSSCAQCVVSNNHFQSLSASAITCAGNNNLIEGNYYTDCAATYPINDTSGLNNVISNNFSSNSTKIELNSASLSPVGYVASVTWDPASLVSGQQDFVAVASPGAAFGQAWVVGVPYDMQNMIAVAFVISAGFIRITVFNSSGATVNLGSGTWTVTRVS